MKEWIADFFACGPGFDLDRITGRGTPYREDIQRLLCSFLEISTKQSRFCALPMVLGDDKVVQILIGATSPEESAELRNIAEAFVGTAYGLVGKEIVSTPIDQASAAILARFPGGLVRIRVPRGVDTSSAYQERANRAMRVVLEMLEQYARRPAMLSETRRPTGRVLRDLFSSLRERDEPASISCLEELKSLKALSARNCVYLELQVRAALGDWRSVLNHPWLPDILPTRLPGRVTVALLAALEESYALTHITTENLSELREVVRPFAPIFERRPKRSSLGERIEYWRTWAVGAALVGNQKDVRQLYADLEDAWIRRLCRLFDWDTEELNDEMQSRWENTIPAGKQEAVDALGEISDLTHKLEEHGAIVILPDNTDESLAKIGQMQKDVKTMNTFKALDIHQYSYMEMLDSVVPACCVYGCQVEPDGTCEHGNPSILLHHGLI